MLKMWKAAKRWFGRTATACVAGLFATSTQAADFQFDHVYNRGCAVTLTGRIEAGDTEKLQQVLLRRKVEERGQDWDAYLKDQDNYEDGELWEWSGIDGGGTMSAREYAYLCLNSPGGSLPEALKMAQFLFSGSLGYTTKVQAGESCESACAVVFMSGNTFEENESLWTQLSRYLEPGAKLGFHAPSLALGDGGTYSGAQVSQSFNIALAAATKMYDFSTREDTYGSRLVPPYVFARFLDTPPEDMYYLDTVGDALLSGLPVIGYQVHVPLDETLVRTICDNVMMLDEGRIHSSSGRTWKNWELDSAKTTVEQYRKTFVNKGEGWFPQYDANYSFEDTFEHGKSMYWGRASGYNTGYPHNNFECLVALSTSPTSITSPYDLDPENYDRSTISVRFRFQDQIGSTLTSLSPQEAWKEQAETAERNPDDDFYSVHEYPWLIAFPFDMPLAELPPPQPKVESMSCDALWFARNKIFHDNGYCFAGPRGLSEFGNEGCHTKSPELSEAEAALVRHYKSLEKGMGC